MVHPVFDFNDASLSDQEKLAALAALSRGFMPAMEMFLNRIKAYTELLEEELEDRPAATQFFGMSLEAANSALEWLSMYSKATEMASESEKVDLRPLLEGAVVRSSRILDTPLEFDCDVPDGGAVTQGILFQLQDVFMRCIQLQGERLSGTAQAVSVHMHELELSEKDVSLLKTACAPGHYVAVSMGPCGSDFDISRQHGFWEFLGENGDRNPAEELPLVLVYGVVREHHGDFLWERGSQADSSVTILMPAESKRKDMHVTPNIDDESLYGDETILLVDDEDMIWDVIIEMLQELGYSVILAGNGKEAVEIYEANPGQIDMVMLDMVMPEMDGHQAFFRLKELDPGVCVLLSSGYVSEEDARDVLDAGAAGFLQKPYRMVDLAKTVRLIFDRSRRDANAKA